MTVEERKRDAQIITRGVLMDVMDDPDVMMVMTRDCIKPEDVEHQVAMILEYLDRTEPEAGEG